MIEPAGFPSELFQALSKCYNEEMKAFEMIDHANKILQFWKTKFRRFQHSSEILSESLIEKVEQFQSAFDKFEDQAAKDFVCLKNLLTSN